jgi:phosphate transport system substrate-binding protein
MSYVRGAVWTMGLSFLLSMAPGCGGTDEGADRGPGSKAAATILVDGSSTVFRISKAAQEGFNRVDPEITVVVDNHGTGGGFSRYLQGEVDIVDASRAAKADEEAKAKQQGIDWTRFLVGYDGITLVVNPKNDFVKSLTVEQLKAIWEVGSKIRTWKDVSPSWPDRRIIFYSPDNDSGTFEFFTEAITGKARSQRDDVEQNANDNILVNGVANDADGLSYFGYAYFDANREKLRALGVAKGAAEPVMPSPATIADKSYSPLSRPLYIYVKNSASRRPEVKQFLKYYLENIEKLAVKARYDAPTAEERSANLETLSKLLSGSIGESTPTTPSKTE